EWRLQTSHEAGTPCALGTPAPSLVHQPLGLRIAPDDGRLHQTATTGPAPTSVRASSSSPKCWNPCEAQTWASVRMAGISPSGLTVTIRSNDAGSAVVRNSSVLAHTLRMYSRKSATSLMRSACASSVDMPVP